LKNHNGKDRIVAKTVGSEGEGRLREGIFDGKAKEQSQKEGKSLRPIFKSEGRQVQISSPRDWKKGEQSCI